MAETRCVPFFGLLKERASHLLPILLAIMAGVAEHASTALRLARELAAHSGPEHKGRPFSWLPLDV
jgi:hypothetical protein